MTDSKKVSADFAAKLVEKFGDNKRAKEMYDDLNSRTTINDAHEVEVRDFDEVLYSRLPEGCTVEMLDELTNLGADLSLATTAAIGHRITEHAINNPAVGQMGWRGHTRMMDYGVSYTRPTVKKPTRGHYEKSTTCYTAVRKHDLELEVKESLADLWLD